MLRNYLRLAMRNLQRNKGFSVTHIAGLAVKPAICLRAPVSNVIILLCNDFLLLLTFSALIAFPLSWWYMHYLLQGFAYRITVGWPVFALVSLLVLLSALFTVSHQAIKAAIANPAKSLQRE